MIRLRHETLIAIYRDRRAGSSAPSRSMNKEKEDDKRRAEKEDFDHCEGGNA